MFDPRSLRSLALLVLALVPVLAGSAGADETPRHVLVDYKLSLGQVMPRFHFFRQDEPHQTGMFGADLGRTEWPISEPSETKLEITKLHTHRRSMKVAGERIRYTESHQVWLADMLARLGGDKEYAVVLSVILKGTRDGGKTYTDEYVVTFPSGDTSETSGYRSILRWRAMASYDVMEGIEWFTSGPRTDRIRLLFHTPQCPDLGLTRAMHDMAIGREYADGYDFRSHAYRASEMDGRAPGEYLVPRNGVNGYVRTFASGLEAGYEWVPLRLAVNFVPIDSSDSARLARLDRVVAKLVGLVGGVVGGGVGYRVGSLLGEIIASQMDIRPASVKTCVLEAKEGDRIPTYPSNAAPIGQWPRRFEPGHHSTPGIYHFFDTVSWAELGERRIFHPWATIHDPAIVERKVKWSQSDFAASCFIYYDPPGAAVNDGTSKGGESRPAAEESKPTGASREPIDRSKVSDPGAERSIGGPFRPGARTLTPSPAPIVPRASSRLDARRGRIR